MVNIGDEFTKLLRAVSPWRIMFAVLYGERSPLRMTFRLPRKRSVRATSSATRIRMILPIFWDAHLARTTDLVAALSERQKAWGASILPASKPAAGKVRTLALRHLAAQCGIGARWIGQFATGFPITGVLSQKGVFAQSKPAETAVDPAILFHKDEARFREREAKAGRKNADLLWKEALGQAERVGWAPQWNWLILAARPAFRRDATTYLFALEWNRTPMLGRATI